MAAKKEKELTELQLEDLQNFIRKINYSKEELVTERNNELSDKILVEEDWIRSAKKSWRHLIQFLIQKFDLDWLISKIAFDLYINFEKTISQGQAEAVIRRVLGIKLSSTGRSQLYELRKKIRRYEKFLTHFGEWGIYDFLLKVVIMGLSDEQTNNLLPITPLFDKSPQKLTIGVVFYPKIIEISGKRVKLQIWNITTEKRFRSLIQQYCRGTNGAIIVYDKSDHDSFELAKEYYTELKEGTNLKFKLKERKGTYVEMPIILIGLGDEKKVTAEEGHSLVREWGAYGYIEIAEKDTQHFENVLSSLSLGIITKYQNAMKKL